jgi:uncharacterized membrane protein (DUF373 family)
MQKFKLSGIFLRAIKVLEYLVAALMLVFMFICVLQYIPRIYGKLLGGTGPAQFQDFLSYSLMIIIGIEFIKMICKPTLANEVEVLIFAMARYIIVEHSSMLSNLLGVLAVGVLFVIRKYLVIEHPDSGHSDTK